ncbi:MAG: hypothetical protein H6708_10310 [Kofleriaceae bacterium]|nr:hypothetical protein [Kofleriaceae bacterium]
MTRRGPLLLSLGAVAIAAALAVTGTSCGGDPACGEHSHDPTCAACTGDEDVAAAGTTVAGDDGVFSIELVTASEQFTPGSQSIVIRVVDGDGAPVDGVSFDHIEVTGNGHGSPLVPDATPTGTAGEYEITMIAYLEPVPSQLTFTISAGGASDVVVFEFCVVEAPAA